MDILHDTINEYRNANGVKSIRSVNVDLCNKCGLHCLAMARVCDVYHAPEYYLEGFVELVAVVSVFTQSQQDICNALIFNAIGGSREHRDALLAFNEIGHFLYIHHYRAYLTIRGR